MKVLKKVAREVFRMFPLPKIYKLYLMGFVDKTYKEKYDILTKKFSLEEIDALKASEKLYPKNILDTGQTIDEIVNNHKSICRLGDGEEFKDHILSDNPIMPRLKERLIEILENGSDENCLVSINNFNVFNERLEIFYRKHFALYWLGYSVKKLCDTVKFNEEKVYGDAYSFLYYFSKYDTNEVRKQRLEKIKSIWQDKKVLFVVSKNSKILEDKSYFDNAVKKECIIGPSKWAFKEYDSILKQITDNYDNSWLVYLELGSCATVLSYDLSKLGYTALDMGDFYSRIVLNKKSREAYAD